VAVNNLFSLVIVFPSLPDMRLSVNGRNKIHFMERTKLVEVARNEAYYLAKDALSKCDYWTAPQLARISYEFYSNDRRIKDLEKGLVPAAGAWIDGIVSAGVLVSDDGWHLWLGHGELRYSTKNRTHLIIESLEE
jgi:hypothetical protein